MDVFKNGISVAVVYCIYGILLLIGIMRVLLMHLLGMFGCD